ncbi:hypothetical protein [Limnoglobus roseus]|uniref:Quinol:cytochrome C oxidoreductase n=1 Tax=Limnoglobus roseus TaxID=2598579 RepID=A0A5C1AAX2_9BACT|nr:hypothetical protein [Limnoglobus roseus]QEL15367.1 hypothetical protein PX52LOC_02282 [Limnoglobus roseus]
MTEHHHDDSHYVAPTIEANYAPLRRVALLSAVVGTVAFLALGIANASMNAAHGGVRDLFLTYQSGFVFWSLVPIGAMTLMLIGYLCSTSWALVFRRVFQAAMRTWPLMFVLFLPVAASALFMGHDSSFWWAVPAGEFARDHANGDPVVTHEVAHRQGLYLNGLFFLLRAVIIFGVFGLLMRAMLKWAPAAEDEGNAANKSKLKGLGGPGVLVWALLFTVAMTDWVMSVEPAWSSSMFPVVAAMDCFLVTMAFSALVFYSLVGENQTALTIVKDKFRIDIGSLMYAFTMIWAYASFGQYMLIWAGNIPEEIGYYRKRLNGGWEFVAYALMAIHWLLPFVIFLFREVKTNPKSMKAMSIMLLAICATDVIWWIVPCVPHAEDTQFFHLLMAIAAIAMVGGIWGLAFLGQLRKANLLPKKDTAFLANWGHH